jgi:hypothetical protein
MLKKFSFVTALLLAIAFGVMPAANASVPISGDCTRGACGVDATIPGDPSGTDPGVGGGGGAPGGVGTVVQPGPTSCQNGDKEVACSSDMGSWSNSDQCYWRLADPQKAPPPGKSPSDGAWYDCTQPPATSGSTTPGVAIVSTRWLDQPPPGVNKMTPSQAAAQLLRQFTFQGVPIGIVPEAKPGSMGSVGLPVWMWVATQTQDNYGPWTQSATIGGVAITGTAKVTSIDWAMGDGGVVSCANPGTPYQDGYGVAPSPTCGYIYSRMSKDQPGGKYTVTATSHWTFDWQAAGQAGASNTTVQSNTQLDIGEMQTVIINR